MQASDRLYYTFQTLVDADQLLDSPEGSTSRERAAADLKVHFQPAGSAQLMPVVGTDTN